MMDNIDKMGERLIISLMQELSQKIDRLSEVMMEFTERLSAMEDWRITHTKWGEEIKERFDSKFKNDDKRLDMLEKSDSDYEKLSERVNKLEAWQYKSIGGLIVLSIVFGYLFDYFVR